VRAEGRQGFGGGSFHGGFEQRFNRVALRGGARYTVTQWNPTGGIGFDLSHHVALDVAAFGTSANIERKRQVALAASIRIKSFSGREFSHESLSAFSFQLSAISKAFSRS
jgi:hypothetical protein